MSRRINLKQESHSIPQMLARWAQPALIEEERECRHGRRHVDTDGTRLCMDCGLLLTSGPVVRRAP